MEAKNSVTMKGVNGRLVWGYQEAAALVTWELSGNAAGGHVHATARTVNAFAASQQPLVFVVVRPKAVWRWPVTSPLQQHGSTVSFTVGPCEE